MATKTVHFIQAVALDRPVLVEPEQARQVMEVYIAADLSAETNEPVTLPLANKRSARLAGLSLHLGRPDAGQNRSSSRRNETWRVHRFGQRTLANANTND